VLSLTSRSNEFKDFPDPDVVELYRRFSRLRKDFLSLSLRISRTMDSVEQDLAAALTDEELADERQREEFP
jgi:hypothetical protein